LAEQIAGLAGVVDRGGGVPLHEVEPGEGAMAGSDGAG
jgi:hypothetical protein